jgi:hypothetical protein
MAPNTHAAVAILHDQPADQSERLRLQMQCDRYVNPSDNFLADASHKDSLRRYLRDRGEPLAHLSHGRWISELAIQLRHIARVRFTAHAG